MVMIYFVAIIHFKQFFLTLVQRFGKLILKSLVSLLFFLGFLADLMNHQGFPIALLLNYLLQVQLILFRKTVKVLIQKQIFYLARLFLLLARFIFVLIFMFLSLFQIFDFIKIELIALNSLLFFGLAIFMNSKQQFGF